MMTTEKENSYKTTPLSTKTLFLFTLSSLAFFSHGSTKSPTAFWSTRATVLSCFLRKITPPESENGPTIGRKSYEVVAVVSASNFCTLPQQFLANKTVKHSLRSRHVSYQLNGLTQERNLSCIQIYDPVQQEVVLEKVYGDIDISSFSVNGVKGTL